jgi:hypothetical protein
MKESGLSKQSQSYLSSSESGSQWRTELHFGKRRYAPEAVSH